MTVENAILAADRMRPNNPFEVEDKWRWLAECDALIRAQVVEKSTCFQPPLKHKATTRAIAAK